MAEKARFLEKITKTLGVLLVVSAAMFPLAAYSFKYTVNNKDEPISRYGKTKDTQRSIALREHLDNIKKKVFPKECFIPVLELTKECKFEYYEQIAGSMEPGGQDYNEKNIDPRCVIKQPKYPPKCDKYFTSLEKTREILISMPEEKWKPYVDALLNKHSKR